MESIKQSIEISPRECRSPKKWHIIHGRATYGHPYIYYYNKLHVINTKHPSCIICLHRPHSTYIHVHIPHSNFNWVHIPHSTFIWVHIPHSTFIWVHISHSTFIWVHLPHSILRLFCFIYAIPPSFLFIYAILPSFTARLCLLIGLFSASGSLRKTRI